MRANKQLVLALLMAAVSGVIVLGSLSLSFFESGYTLVESQAGTPISLIPGNLVVTLFAQQAVSGGNVGIETPLPPTGAVVGQILPPTATFAACAHPQGWQTITISMDDTLASLAHTYNSSILMLKQANCLVIDQLVAGSVLSVPALPNGQTAATIPPTASCSPPTGWIRYTVRYGDTLYNLGYRLGYSSYQLQLANCLTTSYIYTGQPLRLPYYPPALLPTSTLGPVFTPWVPTATWRVPTTTPIIMPVPSFTPTSIVPPVWTATNTAVPTVSITEVPPPATATEAPLPSNTPVTPEPSATIPPSPVIPTNTEPAPVIVLPPTPTSTPVAPPPAPPPVIIIPPTPLIIPVVPSPSPQPVLPPAPTTGTYPFP